MKAEGISGWIAIRTVSVPAEHLRCERTGLRPYSDVAQPHLSLWGCSRGTNPPKPLTTDRFKQENQGWNVEISLKYT